MLRVALFIVVVACIFTYNTAPVRFNTVDGRYYTAVHAAALSYSTSVSCSMDGEMEYFHSREI